MKKIMMTALLLVCTVSIAQKKQLSDEQKQQAKVQLEQYFEKLNLSEDQKTVYEVIAKEYGELLKSVKESEDSKQGKLKEIQRIQSDKDRKLKQLLSKEQYALYHNFKTEEHKKRMENYDGEFSEYINQLNLSEDQKTDYEVIAKEYRELLKFVNESGHSKQEMLKEIQRIQSDKDTKLKQLLSKEQYALYQNFETEKRKKRMENYDGEFSEYINRMSLSEDQMPIYIEISKKYGSQLKALKNSSKSKLSKYKKYKNIQDEKNSEMKKILSSKQYKIYLEVQKEVQKEMKERRKKQKEN